MSIKITFISKKKNKAGIIPGPEIIGIFSNEKEAVEKTILWLVKNRKPGFNIGVDDSILDTPQDFVDVYGRESWAEFSGLLDSNTKFDLEKDEVSETETKPTPSVATVSNTPTIKQSKNKTNKKNRKWWYYPSNQKKGGNRKRKTQKKK